MVEADSQPTEKAPSVQPAERITEGKPEKAPGLKSTLVSLVTLIIALVLIYYAVTFLMGSDFNIDTLLTGERVTRLP